MCLLFIFLFAGMDGTISQDFIPKIGMEFETEFEAYDFCMKYAKVTDFGTRKLSAAHTEIKLRALSWTLVSVVVGKVLEQQTIDVLQLRIIVLKLGVNVRL